MAYNWEFKTRYAPLIQGGVTQPPGKPNAPTALTVADLGATSLKLSWAAATGALPIASYTVYRNGTPIGQTAGLSLADSGLTPATQYSYFVTATDSRAIPRCRAARWRLKPPTTARRPIRGARVAEQPQLQSRRRGEL